MATRFARMFARGQDWDSLTRRGAIRTLTIDVKAKFVPNDNRENDLAPALESQLVRNRRKGE